MAEKTPRERLAELRKAEAEAAKQTPTVGGLPIPSESPTVNPNPPEVTVEITGPESVVTAAAVAAASAAAGDGNPDDPWTIYCGDIVGGTFQYRDTIVQLDGEYVRAESAVHAQAIRDHLTKVRADLGLTASPGTLRRMPTLQDQR